ncbi:kelch repeat-containing protein [Roseivirga sp. E12]|uniref:Kelch repeat-containing protein n=1 Tax=Roseivirga sp. E12 TaxID=2819237 RepID=UPI001ABC519D|nr:kelch repeat-containing protein [Roseivirga sp. E12]MBO3697962.1 hypothetical protein [Roseivirga sp. E12]
MAQNEPLGRNQPVMTYMDHLGSAVLFGGYANQERLNDTWIWNGIWTQVNGLVSPSPRSGHSMTYDTHKELLYMFGGRGKDGLLNDTWTFDGENWKEIKTQNVPTARQSHRITYNPIEKQIYLFGGSGNDRNSLSDTWTFDGQNWTEVKSDVKGRMQHTMVFDPNLKGLLVFGGFSRKDGKKQLPSETLIMKDSQWHVLDIDGPAPRDHHAAVYDPHREASLIFGGYNSDYLNDTWQFKNSQWTQLDNQGPFRAGKPAIFKVDAKKIVMFGGASPEKFGLTDFWVFADKWAKWDR